MRTFQFEQKPQASASDDVSLSLVTFPSPVTTKYDCNNTVHCEYYCPTSPGKHPACVVLHILGGDFPLSRTFATALAHRGVAALFVIMPYYGPRRPPDCEHPDGLGRPKSDGGRHDAGRQRHPLRSRVAG